MSAPEWQVEHGGSGVVRVTDDNGNVIATVEGEDRDRNAALLAAAPDLLESVVALNAALAAVMVGGPLDRELVNRYQRAADAAVAKAQVSP